MKIAVLLFFSVGSCVVIGSLGAAVSTRAPSGSTNTGTPNRGLVPSRSTKSSMPNTSLAQRRPSQLRNTARTKPPALRKANLQAGRRDKSSPVTRPNARQKITPSARKDGAISPRQIPGIPAGPPDSGIDDKVVTDTGETSIPTIIPPVDVSPTAPQQNTDETTTDLVTEPPITDTLPPQTFPTIGPQTTTTIAPQTTTTIAPQTTTTISPQTTTTISPQTTTTIAPQTTTTIAPQTTTTIAPQTTTTIAPQTTTTIAPQRPPTPAPTPPPTTPCIPIPPQKSTVVYVPRPVIRHGYFQRPPPLKQPPPVVVVNNEISTGKPCPATGVAQAAGQPPPPAVQSYGPNMIVVNNPQGAPPIPQMVYNNGRPPPILGPSGK